MTQLTGNRRPTNTTFAACLMLLSLLLGNYAVADLSVKVDRTEISDADLLKLTIRIDNATSSTTPDFRALERDFDIVQRSGPNQSSRISIINGRQTSEIYVAWELRLRPKRLGNLTIPIFQVGQDRSRPISIKVSKQSAAMQRKMSQLVFFDTSVDTTETYVQGQVLYTVKLYYVENISGDFPPLPDLADAVVETIENERRYDAITNGRRYYVLEKRYGIYPQSSGTLTIPAQTFSGYRVGPGFFSTREPVLSRSESHTITVKPKPVNFQGDHWLPATDFNITATWIGGTPSFTVGEPINRSIEMSASGVASSLLPVLPDTRINGAKTYQDPPVEEQSVSAEGLKAKQTIVVGIVPTQPGTLALPEIKIPWWNTKTDQLEYATIPAESFTVAPSPQSAVTVPNRGVETVTDARPTNQTPQAESEPYWKYIAAALLILWLGTIALWAISSRRNPKSKSVAKAPKVAGRKEAFKALQTACKQSSGHAAMHQLQRWGFEVYGGVQTLQDLCKVANNSALTTAVADLEYSMFAGPTSTNWNGSELLDAVSNIERNTRSRQESRKQDLALEKELNPG